MGVLTVTHLTLVLTVFCIHNVIGGSVTDLDSGGNDQHSVKINDLYGYKGKRQAGLASPRLYTGARQDDVATFRSYIRKWQQGQTKNKRLYSGTNTIETGHDTCNVDCGHWCYPSEDWSYTCPNFCAGAQQSPIDIFSASTTAGDGSTTLTFSSTYSDAIKQITLNNNGHTVSGSWDSNLKGRTISGGGLTGPYTLAGFHFHWGCRSNRGSEHTIDGTRYAMELHLVHYKTSYGNLSNAINYEDGLAVLGIFFNVGAENDELKPITDSLPGVAATGSKKEVVFNRAVVNLIPRTRDFYRYQGSLTTPTCNEVVTWSVFTTSLSISENQLTAFRSLKNHEGHKLCDNYRGIQPLNGRNVASFKKHSVWGNNPTKRIWH